MNDGDKSDTTPNGWTGMFFKRISLGTNPLMAGYVGYPYAVRGTDPASSATDALSWAQSGMQTPESLTTATGFPSFGVGDFLGWVKDKFHAFAVGAAGVELGMIVVAVGLVMLLTTDAGKTIVKGAASAA